METPAPVPASLYPSLWLCKPHLQLVHTARLSMLVIGVKKSRTTQQTVHRKRINKASGVASDERLNGRVVMEKREVHVFRALKGRCISGKQQVVHEVRGVFLEEAARQESGWVGDKK